MALGDSAKADQIAFHIYTKLFHVLYAARASEQAPGQGKTDKWFNLETPLAPSASTPTLELDAFRALSASPPPPQRALAVQVLLVVPPPGGGTALVHKASGTRLEPEPRFVLLEEWVLAFAASSASSISTSGASTSSASTSSSASDTATSRSSSTDDESSADVLPPTIYKNAIPLFRALYALLRILPAWRVVRKLTSRRAPLGAGGGPQAQGKRGLRVVVRLRPESSEGMRMGGNGETTLSFGESPAPEVGAPPLPTSAHVFPGIQHPADAHITSPSSHFTPSRLHALTPSLIRAFISSCLHTTLSTPSHLHSSSIDVHCLVSLDIFHIFLFLLLLAFRFSPSSPFFLISLPSSIAFQAILYRVPRPLRVSGLGLRFREGVIERDETGVGRSPVRLPFSICFCFFCALPH